MSSAPMPTLGQRAEEDCRKMGGVVVEGAGREAAVVEGGWSLSILGGAWEQLLLGPKELEVAAAL